MQTLIFLQATGGGAGAFMPVFWIAIIAVMYFFMIRPQVKRQKEQAAFATQLDKGLEVVTTSGIIGRINKIEGEIVTLEVDTKTYVRFAKSAISKEMTEQLFGKAGKTAGPVETKD